MFSPPGAASNPPRRCRRRVLHHRPGPGDGRHHGRPALPPAPGTERHTRVRGRASPAPSSGSRRPRRWSSFRTWSTPPAPYFYALARAQAALALQQDLLATAQQFDQIARQQVALGARPGIEQTQTAIEVARARQLVAQAQGEEQAARAALNAYLGRAPLDPIDTSRGLPATAGGRPGGHRRCPAAGAGRAGGDRRRPGATATSPPPRPSCTAPRAGPTSRPRSASARSRRPTWTPASASSSPCRLTTARAGARSASRSRPPRPRRTAWPGHRPRSGWTPSRRPSASTPPRPSWASTTPACSPTPARCWTRPCSASRPGRRRSSRVLDAQRTYRQIVSDQLNAQASVAEARAALDRATGTLPPSLLPNWSGTLICSVR